MTHRMEIEKSEEARETLTGPSIFLNRNNAIFSQFLRKRVFLGSYSAMGRQKLRKEKQTQVSRRRSQQKSSPAPQSQSALLETERNDKGGGKRSVLPMPEKEKGWYVFVTPESEDLGSERTSHTE